MLRKHAFLLFSPLLLAACDLDLSVTDNRDGSNSGGQTPEETPPDSTPPDNNWQFAESFESQDWYSNWGLSGAPQNTSVVADASAPMGDSILRVQVPQGEHYGTSFGYKFSDMDMEEPDEAYFSYAVRFGPTWTTQGAGGGKLPGFGGTYDTAGWGGRASDGSNGWSARGLFWTPASETSEAAGDTRVGFYTYHADMTSTWGDNLYWSGEPLDNGTMERNRWYQVKMQFKNNTPADHDGVLRAWVDGKLVYEKTDIRFRDIDALHLEKIWFDIYYGGDWVAPQDMYVDFDAVTISLAPIADPEPAPNEGDSDDGSFKPLLTFDMADADTGNPFLNWTRSVYDDTHSVSNGVGVKIRTRPGNKLLPECDGSHFFAGRTKFDEDKRVTPGHTLWYRVMMYIPSTFSFGYKYGRGDNAAASACNQDADGNYWYKWLVVSPTNGTGRVYLETSTAYRSLSPDQSQIRLVPEATQKVKDMDVDYNVLPRDQWFALQIAIKVSSDPNEGYVRAWLNDEFLGQLNTATFDDNSSTYDWGIGNYWNGVPWTDGNAGRTEFWIDEIILATDMPGYGAPTAVDVEGHPYIPANLRVGDLAN